MNPLPARFIPIHTLSGVCVSAINNKPQDHMHKTKFLPFLEALFAVIVWGGSFIATKIAVGQISPTAVVWLRFAIGIPILLFAVIIAQTICISKGQRVVVLRPAWLSGNFISSMAAIQRTANRTGHNYCLDRFHIARVHRHIRLAGLKRKTKPRAIVGDRAGHGRCDGGREQRRPFLSCRSASLAHTAIFSFSSARSTGRCSPSFRGADYYIIRPR